MLLLSDSVLLLLPRRHHDCGGYLPGRLAWLAMKFICYCCQCLFPISSPQYVCVCIYIYSSIMLPGLTHSYSFHSPTTSFIYMCVRVCDLSCVSHVCCKSALCHHFCYYHNWMICPVIPPPPPFCCCSSFTPASIAGLRSANRPSTAVHVYV